MAKKCARTFSIVVEKGKKSILDVGHLLPGGIARYVARVTPVSATPARCDRPTNTGREQGATLCLIYSGSTWIDDPNQ